MSRVVRIRRTPERGPEGRPGAQVLAPGCALPVRTGDSSQRARHLRALPLPLAGDRVQGAAG